MSEMFQQIRRLAADTFSEHKITVRMDAGGSGLFRSYRCQKPGTWCYGFDVTFTPGWVVLAGDIGFLALSREADMLPWLRGVVGRESGSIDLRYIAEKVPQCIETRKWSEWASKWVLECIFEAYGEDGLISEDDREDLLVRTSDEYTWTYDAIPKLLDLGVHEFYEFGDAKDWTAGFCWCVLGLEWFVKEIDK